MKPKSDCIACLVERTKYECDMAFNDDGEKIFALKEFIAFLVEHLGEEGKSPAFFGTERERIIKRRSGAKDPHGEVKKRSNEVAKGLLPEVYKFYDAAKNGNKIEALIRIAAAANSMEYGVKGYSYDDDVFKGDFVHTLNEKLNWDMDSIISAIKERDEILYLTDNAGEIFFDAFVIRELIEMGKEVVVSPKNAPVINDATTEDLKEAIASVGTGIQNFRFENRIKVIPSGSCIGVSLEGAEEEFLDVFSDDRYLVITKGMGNYEAISEFEAKPELGLRDRLIYILRAKCEPIASSIGVKRGELVAKLV